MPIPKPKKDESHDDFIDRCMSDEVMVNEYDDTDQRLAVCESQWDSSREEAAPDSRIERRLMAAEDIEMRVEGEDEATKLIGYAAKFNKWSQDIGWGFREKIAKGAFTEALKNSDVRALKNHDANLILGRTESGTLRLQENNVGLKFDLDIPSTSTGRDTAEEIRRGDITGCSFAFTTAADVWVYNEDGTVERTITAVGELYDIGPVVYPAYKDTTVSARSVDVTVAQRSMEAFMESRAKQEQEEPQTIDRDRQRQIERGYRTAGRIINRNRSAES
jgi:HK97 family phage prohead protease